MSEDPPLHPVAEAALALFSSENGDKASGKGEGELALSEEAVVALAGELAARFGSPDLVEAVVGLLELAYVFEEKMGAPQAANALLGLCLACDDELAALSSRAADEARAATVDATAKAGERFAQFSGAAKPVGPSPGAPSDGAVRAGPMAALLAQKRFERDDDDEG